MTLEIPTVPIPLSKIPQVSIMAMGLHGPKVTEKFSSNDWWLHLYTYSATLRIMGATLAIRPCCATIIPPGTELEYDFPDRSAHLCAHFMLSENSYDAIEAPVLVDLGEQFPAIYDQMEDAVACFASNPLRAQVRLWDLLWQLAEPRPRRDLWVHNNPGVVRQARNMIELRLGDVLIVKDLAQELGISHNHLTRLFRESTGQTVIGYIRSRRADRAANLLRQTTLPIATVASQVGIEEPRLLNKLMHELLGLSPTQIRTKAQDRPAKK